MRRVSYFATKLNSRDVQKFDCLWVPPVISSPLLAKQYFPRLRQLAFTDWETRSRLCLLSDWWWGGGGGGWVGWKVICHKKVQQSFLNQNLDLLPSPKSIFFELYLLVARRAQYNFIYVIWKLCLIIGILEEQETYLLRAFLIILFPVVRWFLVLKHPD